jgi:hypothetical protein
MEFELAVHWATQLTQWGDRLAKSSVELLENMWETSLEIVWDTSLENVMETSLENETDGWSEE